jgi:hypothetical protein
MQAPALYFYDLSRCLRFAPIGIGFSITAHHRQIFARTNLRFRCAYPLYFAVSAAWRRIAKLIGVALRITNAFAVCVFIRYACGQKNSGQYGEGQRKLV